jgi:hypothetical protein
LGIRRDQIGDFGRGVRINQQESHLIAYFLGDNGAVSCLSSKSG